MALQRLMAQAVMRPLTKADRMQPRWEDGRSTSVVVEGFIKPNDRLTSFDRLEIYNRQYWFRLLDSVADDFPALRKMAGEEKFWSLIEAYLQACPSGSYTLRHLGRSMAKFIAGWEGFDETRRLWFCALAELEYGGMEVAEAAEREPLPPEQLASTEIELQPHVRLIELPVPADLCLKWDEFAPAEAGQVYIAMWRGPQGAHMSRVEAVEFELLRRLQQGGTLAGLFAEPVEPEPSPEEVQEWFSTWQSRGWITARGSAIIDLVVSADEDWSDVSEMASQAMAMEDQKAERSRTLAEDG